MPAPPGAAAACPHTGSLPGRPPRRTPQLLDPVTPRAGTGWSITARGAATLMTRLSAHALTHPVTLSADLSLKAAYSNHYRKGLIRLLEVLAFRSGNTTHRPVIEALGLISRHAHDGNTRYYPLGEHVPVHSGMTGDWAELVYRADRRGRRRVVRLAYEVVAFQALRDRLRCKEIWVEGADRWRNPDQDLPADFEERRAAHYQALRKPLDPSRFVDELLAEHRRELAALNDALPRLAWLDVADRPGGAIRLSPLDAAPEPRNLRRLKHEVERRWGTVPLIDMLKEAALRTGCLQAVTSVAGRADLDPQVLAERLLLCVYAYGTNTGLRAVAAGDHRHTEDDLRYVRRRYLSSEVAAMVEGAMHHGTAMQVEGNYVDSHGQSEIGFGITRLLGFDLLPRIKRINQVRLYRPAAGEPDASPQLGPALTRTIRWRLIGEQYDMMVRYATAIRVGTAATEAILRRFTRAATHPTYQAMLEVGRAQKTIFVARYLRDRDLQREVCEGINVL